MSGFPTNVLDEVSFSLKSMMSDHSVEQRALRPTDAALSIGVFIVDWTPDEQSIEIGPQSEPVLGRYHYRIQNLVKSATEEEGKQLFSLYARSIRVVLYRDPNLRVRLGKLTESLLGSRETAKKWGVGRQRFLNNSIRGSFLYLAETEFWLETETTKL